MKTLLLILIPFFSIAQSKYDNYIVVNEYVGLPQIKQALFENRYIIDGSDTAYFITHEKQLNKWEASVKLIIARKDSSVTFKVLLKGMFSTDFYPVDFRGAKGSMIRTAWAEMEKIARSLSSKISYGKTD